MKISIITEANKNTGFGHLTRCISLYQAFEERNIIPKIYLNGDDSVLPFLEEINYEMFDWLENKNDLLRKIKNSDAIIVDSYIADISFYETISKMTLIPLYFDDTLRLDYPSGIILNGAVNAETLPYKKTLTHEYLLGLKFLPLRKEFWEIFEKPLRLDIQNIILTFGGSDQLNLTTRVLRLLTRNYPSIKKRVIVTQSFQTISQIEEVKDSNTEIYNSPTPTELLKILYDTDLAICSGGQTLNELARVGIPTIAIATADNQKIQLAGWVKEKFLQQELSYDLPNLEHRLSLLISNLRKKQVREVISKIGKQKIDGNGAKRVIQYIIDKHVGKSGFYFRQAISKDATIIFNLSNDRLVRANSINTEPIKWGDHLDWFSGKLLDDNCYFLLAFTPTNQFIGQVRFDIKGYYAEINISIDKDFRGKGFSKQLIFSASYKLFHDKPNINFINAIIRPNNTPSIKAFMKSGYKLIGKEIINDEEFLLYQLKK
ncbi:MAG: bifunctional UDP-2,4-diacetamido-2,4,6-trideoxy-beta-L-altropyranose hydrolase/GNAT family N-acetyltransferase [Melioribacteraceae bacterium]|nr:bifunctional UDP-2,4-diacetamido-2,4,6-trideoxy-beta-L-altropyranose hydrolase/GNAT family N-acetyltransferase [Melioribacteraceae bacterium]